MPTTNESQEPFVKRVEMAIMQYVILNKAQQGEVTRENLKQTFRGNLQMSGDHFDHCINQLVQDKHLKEVGGKYTVTDDGREDIHKLQTIVMELPNVIQQGGGQTQGQRQTQTQTAGGRGGSTGSTVGNQGSYGSSSPQGRDAGSQSGSDQPGKSSTQSGVSGQQRTGDVSKGR